VEANELIAEVKKRDTNHRGFLRQPQRRAESLILRAITANGPAE